MTNADRLTELQAWKKEILAGLRCALPGTVVSFDETACKAVIRPEAEGLPLLRDVPVYLPVRLDIREGAKCLVVFADSDIARWALGEEAAALSPRRHSLSDGIAFVGFGSAEGIGEYYTREQADGILEEYCPKAEMDARLGGLAVRYYSYSNTLTLALEPYAVYLIVLASAASTHQGLWIAYVAANAYVYAVEKGANVSHAAGGATVTFTNSTSRACRVAVVKLLDVPH